VAGGGGGDSEGRETLQMSFFTRQVLVIISRQQAKQREGDEMRSQVRQQLGDEASQPSHN